MIVAIDVQYTDDDANRSIVVFDDWRDERPTETAHLEVLGVEPYVPREFYRRELPCLLTGLNYVIKNFGNPGVVIIDGYVTLDEGKSGLGKKLYEATGIPVVGVAKSTFHQAQAVPVFRGKSKNPLYATSVGTRESNEEIASFVSSMHGLHRNPTLLKMADRIARESSKESNEGVAYE